VTVCKQLAGLIVNNSALTSFNLSIKKFVCNKSRDCLLFVAKMVDETSNFCFSWFSYGNCTV